MKQTPRTPAIVLTQTTIARALGRLEPAIAKYRWLQREALRRNVSVDEAFQRSFNGYYRVRRAATWRTAFYRLFEERKGRGVQFDHVLRDLYAATGRVEASFASKLVATLDPAQPVIDQLVLKNVHLRLATYGDAATRLQRATDVHAKLRDLFASFLASREGRAFIKEFDHAFGGETLTATKKLDLVLWQAR